MEKPMLFSKTGGAQGNLPNPNSSVKFNLKDQYSFQLAKHEGHSLPNDHSRYNNVNTSNQNIINVSMNQSSNAGNSYEKLEVQSRHQSVRGNKIFSNQNQHQERPITHQSRENSPNIFNSASSSPDGFGKGVPQSSNGFDNSYEKSASYNWTRQSPQQQQQQFRTQSSLKNGNQNQALNLKSISYQRNNNQIDDNKRFSSDTILQKAEGACQQLQNSSQILEEIVDKRRQLFNEYDLCLEKIELQKRKLHECSKQTSKSFFLQNTSNELLQFKDKKKELQKVQENCQSMVKQYEAIENRLKQNLKKETKSKLVDSQGEEYKKDEFEFESSFLSLSDQCQQKMGNIQAAVENYKKVLKFDKQSTKFIEVQKSLQSTVIKFEEADKELKTDMTELISDFVKQLKILKKEIEENSDFYAVLVSSFEESVEIVQQLLFYRQDKMKELLDRIVNNIRGKLQQYLQQGEENCKINQYQTNNYQSNTYSEKSYQNNYNSLRQQSQLSSYQHQVSTRPPYPLANTQSSLSINNNVKTFFNATQQNQSSVKAVESNRNQVRVQIEQEIKSIRETVKKVKREAKNTHSAQRSMFFVELRAKLISKLIQELDQEVISVVDELEKVNEYCTGGELQNDQEYCQNLVKNAFELIQSFKNNTLIQPGNQGANQDQIVMLISKSHQQLSQLIELNSKLEQLSHITQFQLLSHPFQLMQSQTIQTISELQSEQQLILPSVMYKNEIKHFISQQEEIQNTFIKAKQIISTFINSPQYFLKFKKNFQILPEVLSVKVELQSYHSLVNQLQKFCQSNKSNNNLDKNIINNDKITIQQYMTSTVYYLTNITVISTILEASQCLAPQSLNNFCFKIDHDKHCIISQLKNKKLEAEISLKTLQNLEDRSKFGTELEINLLKSKGLMEQLIDSTKLILSKWESEGQIMFQELEVMRMSVQNQSGIECYISDHLEYLNEEIAYELQGSDTLVESLTLELKNYSECLIRYAFNLERKMLNPYSASYLISWLDSNHSAAFNQLSYLFDLEDLIQYQNSMNSTTVRGNLGVHKFGSFVMSSDYNQKLNELNISVKLLRSRVTESLQSESNLKKLLNQSSIVVDMQLELVLKIVLQDSLLYDYSQFEQLVLIARILNNRVRQSKRVTKTVIEKYEEKLKIFELDSQETKELAKLINNYYQLLSWDSIQSISLRCISQDVRSVIEEEINRNVIIVQATLLGSSQEISTQKQSQFSSFKQLPENAIELFEQLSQYVSSFQEIRDFISDILPTHSQHEQIESDQTKVQNWLVKDRRGRSIQQILESKLRAIQIVMNGKLHNLLAERFEMRQQQQEEVEVEEDEEEEGNELFKLKKQLGLFKNITYFNIFGKISNSKTLKQWAQLLEQVLIKNEIVKDKSQLNNLQQQFLSALEECNSQISK